MGSQGGFLNYGGVQFPLVCASVDSCRWSIQTIDSIHEHPGRAFTIEHRVAFVRDEGAGRSSAAGQRASGREEERQPSRALG